MSTDLHKIEVGKTEYVGYGRGAVVDTLYAHESEVTQFYLMDGELEDICLCVFEEYLDKNNKWKELEWRTEMETLANIIQAVTKDGDCTFELW